MDPHGIENGPGAGVHYSILEFGPHGIVIQNGPGVHILL